MMKAIELPANLNDIKELFKVWKDAHKNDKYWKDTFPQCPCCGIIPPYSFVESFTVDGFLTEKKQLEEKRKVILFVGRESNVSQEINNCGQTEDLFWMEKVWESKENKYTEYLKAIIEKLDANEYDCAYMNINKRGGYSACTLERLNNYVTVYSGFIKKEIELINPNIVVFLGTGEYKYRQNIIGIIKETNENIECYEVFHPSAPGRNRSLDKLKKGITL